MPILHASLNRIHHRQTDTNRLNTQIHKENISNTIPYTKGADADAPSLRPFCTQVRSRFIHSDSSQTQTLPLYEMLNGSANSNNSFDNFTYSIRPVSNNDYSLISIKLTISYHTQDQFETKSALTSLASVPSLTGIYRKHHKHITS